MLANDCTKLFANSLTLAASRGQAGCMFDTPDPDYSFQKLWRAGKKVFCCFAHLTSRDGQQLQILKNTPPKKIYGLSTKWVIHCSGT